MVAAVALPDTRQRLRRGAEHLEGLGDVGCLKIVAQFDNQFVNDSFYTIIRTRARSK